MGDARDEATSIHEMRRRAPLHYEARADNARFAAYAIVTLDQKAQRRCAEQLGYGGDPRAPMGEAFFREAALALELIIKAVIAQRIEMGLAMRHVVRVRPTHDLVALWGDAELSPLSPADQHRLMIARQGLVWSGRYAAPRRDEDYERERREMAAFPEERAIPPPSKLRAVRPRSFSWEDFDRIYQIASQSFWGLRR
jgi:hypothetical protein